MFDEIMKILKQYGFKLIKFEDLSTNSSEDVNMFRLLLCVKDFEDERVEFIFKKTSHIMINKKTCLTLDEESLRLIDELVKLNERWWNS